MKKETILKLLTGLSILLMLVTNSLANILPINGYTTGALSDAIPIFFVPAGYVFAIWGVIYIGIIIYFISLIKNFTKEDATIAPWLIIGNIANSIWIFLWHYKMVYTSVIFMFILLLSLLVIYIKTNKTGVSLLKRIPFSIYLGWISVATIANVSAALYLLQWNGFGISSEFWAVIMVGVATVLTLLMLNIKRDYAYALVLIWALFGILYKFNTTSELLTAGITVSLFAIVGTFVYNMYKSAKRIA